MPSKFSPDSGSENSTYSTVIDSVNYVMRDPSLMGMTSKFEKLNDLAGKDLLDQSKMDFIARAAERFGIRGANVNLLV